MRSDYARAVLASGRPIPYQTENGQLRLIDLQAAASKDSQCKSNELAVSWSQT